jgi:hypothetical protein
MGLGYLTLYRTGRKGLGRSIPLHLSDDSPALTFIQEPTLGPRQRRGFSLGSHHHAGTIANRRDWLDAVQLLLFIQPTVF